MLDKETATITTTAGGAATVRTGPHQGHITAFYVAVGTLDVGTDITITEEETGAAVLTLTNVAASAWYPVTLGTVDQAGAARLYAAAGQAVGVPVPIEGYLKYVVAQGGATKTGTVTVYVE